MAVCASKLPIADWEKAETLHNSVIIKTIFFLIRLFFGKGPIF